MLEGKIMKRLILFLIASTAVQLTYASDWGPFVQMDDQIFPAYVIANAGKDDKDMPDQLTADGTTLHVVGYKSEDIGIVVESPAPNTKIHLEVKLGNISDVSTFDAILPNAGMYMVLPRLLYNYNTLLNIRQPTVINAEFSLSINGVTPEKKYKTIRVRSINDVPYAMRNPNGSVSKIGWMWGAFVNENHPWIDQILREALNTGVINQFDGYQRGPQEVHKQVFAIWNALQRRGFRYSDISTPSGQSARIYSQHVRFLEDAIQTSQANCVDGTVLFSSILKKIGIDPILVWVPGHMFLGFYLDENHTTADYLETTAMGHTSLGQYVPDNSLLGLFATTQNQASAQSYNIAVYAGRQKISQNKSQFQSNDPDYQFLDLDAIRNIGIQPINH